ncbi:restriction endonuclease [Candidatus Thiothrix anitrata]|uniref:Restriction endonuclease n=1 Tax=Candidatus Thiothrix anitrata TaxID=2823902 RepID=A0ABX7WZV5_9GAMM|nr:restriction endonuclease [Candidatus Thiothrix anitrata]QTR48966.1 restriction endonuclease [Candidatus Thiothrix anitrata]
MKMQIPPPQNWQDFESLCWDLWTHIWQDNNTQKNGRAGQPQHGVDIYGTSYTTSKDSCGVQCKGKDIYNNKILTTKELNEEVEKAKNFKPKLHQFIIATTAPKDTKIEQQAREITEKIKITIVFLCMYMGGQILLIN